MLVSYTASPSQAKNKAGLCAGLKCFCTVRTGSVSTAALRCELCELCERVLQLYELWELLCSVCELCVRVV